MYLKKYLPHLQIFHLIDHLIWKLLHFATMPFSQLAICTCPRPPGYGIAVASGTQFCRYHIVRNGISVKRNLHWTWIGTNKQKKSVKGVPALHVGNGTNMLRRMLIFKLLRKSHFVNSLRPSEIYIYIYTSVQHTNTASDNCLVPVRRQAIIWTNATTILPIRP